MYSAAASEVCGECDDCLRHQSNLCRHNIVRPPLKFPTRRTKVCPACGSEFTKHPDFVKHLYQQHNFKANIEVKQFGTEAEFLEWKRSVDSPIKLVVRNVSRTEEKRTIYYRCTRMCGVRTQDTQKIKGTCPAKITATLTTAGPVEVIYCSSHYGHDLQPVQKPYSSSRDCSKSSISSMASNNKLKKEIVRTLLVTLDACRTREDILTCKRIVDSIKPTIGASID